MLKFFFADVDHVNEGLVKRIKWGRVKISEEEKKLKFGVSTCILGFHDFQASILENAGSAVVRAILLWCTDIAPICML